MILLFNCRYERFVIALEEASRDMLPILKDKALKVCGPDMPCPSLYQIYMHMSTQFCSICRAFYYHPLLFDFVLLCIHNSITCLWSSKCCGFKITCLGYSSQVLCTMFFHPTVNSYHLIIRQDFLELSYVFYFVQAMYTLLRSKSEQERRLLSALVNKVFSSDYFCFKNWQMPHFVIILT